MVELRQVLTEHLMETSWDLESVEAYCEMCSKYNVHFSCPHHEFHIPDYLSPYPHALIVVQSFRDALSSNRTFKQRFLHYRTCIDQALMRTEKHLDGSKVLLPGQCRNCMDDCHHTDADTCYHPELIRYSYESLGFNVDSMLRHYFNKKLTFTEGELIYVYGLLLKKPLDMMQLDKWKECFDVCEKDQ